MSPVYYLGIVLILSGTTGFAQEENSIDKLLLRNYRPKSIYNTPKTKIEKAKYRVIDLHAHVYAKTPKEVARWIMSMDETGLEKTIILTQAYGPKFDSIYSLYSDLKFGVVLTIQVMISQGLDPQLLLNWKGVYKLGQKVLGN